MPATSKQKRKPAGSKSSRETSGGKKAAKKKLKKKNTVKKAAKKKAAAKIAKKRAAVKTRKKPSPAAVFPEIEKTPVLVEPGPPPGEVPPVEEPASHEEAIGVVTHYYSDIGVAVIQINRAKLRTGDHIRIKGHTTDFTQTVSSIEFEHHHVEEAVAGQCIGIKAEDHARPHDIVFLE